MSDPMKSAIAQLPVDVQAMLLQDYTDLKIILQFAPSFVLEGKRIDSGQIERIEATDLNNMMLVKRMRKDFELCAADSNNQLRAIDSFISGNHNFFRYGNHGQSLYRTFVHQRPYLGGEEGLDMLNSHLPPVIHRDQDEILKILQAGIGICNEVEKLHAKQVIHSGINPHTTFITNKTVSLRGCYTKTHQASEDENEEETAPNLQNLVMYLSPEATGRTNKSPDFRSDIYSIGCTLYELFVGRPPFMAPDTLSFIHRHLTSRPQSIDKVSNALPVQLGDMLLKCLEKAPDSRYSSVAGLKHDLEALSRLISTGESLESFKVGSLDDLLRFQVPSLLCGRDHEMHILQSTLRKTSSTRQGAIISIKGPSGVGKSQLVGRLVVESRHFVAASKYQQFRRDTTYSTLTSAIQTLVRQILTHNQRDIRNWRSKLLVDIAKTDVLISAIPELKILLGDSAQLPRPITGSAHETRRQLHTAFVHLLTIFSEGRGLIFCQDDVQWANQAELDLIVDLTTQVPGLLMILARRPVEEDDFVLYALETIKSRNVQAIELELSNLKEDAVRTIVTKTVHNQTSPELDSLAHFIYEKTSGNPFLVTQFLHTLHKSNKIYFNVAELRWRFNIRAIKDEELTDDIIAVISSDMRRLPTPVRNLVAIAAALGLERFSASQLAVVMSQDVNETVTQIQVAVDRNIFRAVSTLEVFQIPEESSAETELYSFLHDKTQENAYGLLSPESQTKTHYMIALGLLGDQSSEVTGSAFLLANQFNKCIKLLDSTQSINAVNSNYDAGQMSLRSGDAVSAQYYFEAAEYIADKAQLDNSIRARVRFATIDALLADNAYENAIDLIDKTLPNCILQKDQTRCHVSRMKALIALGRLGEANDTGLSALENLNFPVPATDESAEKFAESMQKTLNHNADSIAKLADRTHLSDPKLLQVQEILSIVVLPVYMFRPRILAALCYLSLSITSARGPSLKGAYPAMMLGAYLSSIGGRDNLVLSYAYGKFALKLLEEATETDEIAPGMYHLFAGHIAVFHHPMAEVMHYEDLAVSTGKAFFNVEYTVFSLVEKPIFLAWSGRDLPQTCKDLLGSATYVINTKSAASCCFLAVHLYGVAYLADIPTEATKLSPFLQAEDVGKEIRASLSMTHAFMWELWQLFIDVYITRDVVHVRQSIRRCCFEYMDGVLGTHYAAMAYWLSAVALMTLKWLGIELESLEEDIIVTGRSRIEVLAEFAPTTFLSMSKFLDTLYYRHSQHDQLKLLDMYDDAIAEAQKNNSHGEAALILESAGRWLQKVSAERSKSYLERAYSSYNRWNCLRKLRALEKEFPWLHADETRAPGRPSAMPTNPYPAPEPKQTHLRGKSQSNHGIPDMGSPSARPSNENDHTYQNKAESTGSTGQASVEASSLSELDIKTVLNASIQISQGMKQEEVLESLMRTVLLAAGADYGVLALYSMGHGENAVLSIHTLADGESIKLMRATPALERPDLLPLSIVNSTLATQKPIIRNDARDYFFDSSFAKDRYYTSREQPLRSVLCMPVPSSNNNKLRGILYLENNATASAFTNQRLECLTLLCTQSAMTLDRAAVYHEMRAAKAQAEEATAQKSTFLANMSHEIRTPFNALLSCSIFLLDTNLTQVQKEYVLTIRDSATLTLSIIDGILDFSKVEQGMMDIVQAPFSLSDTIETAMQVVAQKASGAGIDLVYSRKHKIDAVIGDSLHLRQAVLNLLGNAVKFTSDGYVKITSSTKGETDDNHHIISIIVQDTGIGISSSGIERLFKAFSQVDASINRSYGGTGLGLAISKKLIELMGGNIWLESVEGQGSTFFIDIPVEVDPIASNKTLSMRLKQTDAIKRQGRLALVISRYQTTADVLVDDLTEIGLITHKNTEILNADSIAVAAKERPYTLLIVDLQVEGSLALVESLQKILPSAESHFKIVILTNYGINVPQGMSTARIAGYLVKPISKSKLLETVSSALRHVGTGSDAMASAAEDAALRRQSSVKNVQHSATKQLRILLAEDNIINTKVALQHLKRLGYTDVSHAKDGVEVLEQCTKAASEKNMFDVILMDVQMPRLDGLGASRELVKRYPVRSSRPVIIALTANATSTDRAKCNDAGMSGHIAKPILPDNLLRTLTSISRRGSAPNLEDLSSDGNEHATSK